MAQFRDLPHLAGRLFDTPLCIDARKLEAIVPAFTRRLAGDQDGALDPADQAREADIVTDVGAIAVISAFGSLVRRKTMMQAYSGLTSYADLAQAFDAAVANANVKAILLRLDSFGGEAGGCFELCEKIYAARKTKPVWAVADIYALSGAYAIGCSAERLYVAPSGQVGSIGVVAVHCETSRADDAAGITYTVFRAGARKADLNPLEPLAAAAASRLQASMDKNRDKFAGMVARNRKISKSAVMSTEGAWYDADEALSMKLVDGVAVFDDVLQQLFDKGSGAPERVASGTAPGDDPDDANYDGDEPPAETTVAAPAPLDPIEAFKAAYFAEAGAICQACMDAGHPELQAEYLEKGTSLAQVRAALGWLSAIETQQSRMPRPYTK